MKKLALLILFACSIVNGQIAFKHVATYNDNEFQSLRREEFPLNCIIDNPLINNNPNLILIVTPDYGTNGPYFTGAFSVYYYGDKWIINTPLPTGIPENTKFNVLAVPRGPNAFVHTARTSSRNYTEIDHPLLNGNPNAKFLVTKASFRNTNEIGVIYVPSISKWTIMNLDRSSFIENSFNILVNENIFTVNATSPTNNFFYINNPTTNGGANNLIFTTTVFNGVSNNNPTGVWYTRNKWAIFNQNRVAMPANSMFMVMSLNGSGYTNTDNEVHVFLSDIFEKLCPKTLVRGDREFNGNGPRIQNRITLEVRNNTEIWASIDFTATETVSDFSTTREVFERRIFTSPNNRRISAIISPNVTNIDFVSPKGGTQFIGPNGNSGNTVTNTEPMNFIRRMAIVGDTGGDDISTDNDCTDDTRIESVQFFPIKIRYAN